MTASAVDGRGQEADGWAVPTAAEWLTVPANPSLFRFPGSRRLFFRSQ